MATTIFNDMFNFNNMDEEAILVYKKNLLTQMLNEFHSMEDEYLDNQKYIYHSRAQHNYKYFYKQIFNVITKMWSNISYLCDSQDLKKKIDTLNSEIVFKEKNYSNPLMKKPTRIYHKLSTIKLIYMSTYIIFICFCPMFYKLLHYVTQNVATPFRVLPFYIYLPARIAIVAIVINFYVLMYYHFGDVILWILKALLNIFIFIFTAFIYLLIFFVIALFYILKFLIMGAIIVGTALGQFFDIIIKFFAALPTIIDSIFSGGDTSLALDGINMDLDLSFNMDSMGIGVLDEIDLWIGSGLDMSIGGIDGGVGGEFLKDFSSGLVESTTGFKTFMQNLNNEITGSDMFNSDTSLWDSLSTCSNKSLLQKMVLKANKDKKQVMEDNEKEQKKTGKQNFVKCISS